MELNSHPSTVVHIGMHELYIVEIGNEIILHRQGLVVLEASLPKGEYTVLTPCYNPDKISSSAAFLITLYSDSVFNFTATYR